MNDAAEIFDSQEHVNPTKPTTKSNRTCLLVMLVVALLVFFAVACVLVVAWLVFRAASGTIQRDAVTITFKYPGANANEVDEHLGKRMAELSSVSQVDLVEFDSFAGGGVATLYSSRGSFFGQSAFRSIESKFDQIEIGISDIVEYRDRIERPRPFANALVVMTARDETSEPSNFSELSNFIALKNRAIKLADQIAALDSVSVSKPHPDVGQIAILVDQEQAARHRVTPDDISNSIRTANFESPVNDNIDVHIKSIARSMESNRPKLIELIGGVSIVSRVNVATKVRLDEIADIQFEQPSGSKLNGKTAAVIPVVLQSRSTKAIQEQIANLANDFSQSSSNPTDIEVIWLDDNDSSNLFHLRLVNRVNGDISRLVDEIDGLIHDRDSSAKLVTLPNQFSPNSEVVAVVKSDNASAINRESIIELCDMFSMSGQVSLIPSRVVGGFNGLTIHGPMQIALVGDEIDTVAKWSSKVFEHLRDDHRIDLALVQLPIVRSAEIKVEPIKERIQELGLDNLDVHQFVMSHLGDLEVMRIAAGHSDIGVVIRPDKDRLSNLSGLKIATRDGQVPLNSIAELSLASGAHRVSRLNGQPATKLFIYRSKNVSSQKIIDQIQAIADEVAGEMKLDKTKYKIEVIDTH